MTTSAELEHSPAASDPAIQPPIRHLCLHKVSLNKTHPVMPHRARQVRQELASSGRVIRPQHRQAPRLSPDGDLPTSHAAPSRRPALDYVDRRHHAE
jgi:hypothetical protein